MKGLITFLNCCLFFISLAQQPQFDQTFGVNGKAISNFTDSTNDQTIGIRIQPDGKILLLGTTKNTFSDPIALFRYNINSTLDTSFGEGGKFLCIRNPNSSYPDADMFLKSIALQQDGKILIGGYFGSTYCEFGIIRLTSNGIIDTSYSSDGFAEFYNGSATKSFGIAIQPDQKILITGYNGGVSEKLAVVRFDTSGFPDLTFGNNGIAIMQAIGHWGKEIGIQSTGKIVIGGTVGLTTSTFTARFNSNGTTDSTFGTNGVGIGGLTGCTSMVIQPDDKIIIGSNSGIARLLADGGLDSSFGYNGRITSASIATGTVLISSGKILQSGYSSGAPCKRIVIARYDTYGLLDTTFSNDGIDSICVSNLYDCSSCYTSGYNLQVNPDGSMVISTNDTIPSIFSLNGRNFNFHLMKVDSTGIPDVTFGVNGHVSSSFDFANDEMTDMVQQADGKIIICGASSRENYESHLALARYLSDGTLDTTFGNNRGLDTLILGVASTYQYLNFYPDDISLDMNQKILIAGRSTGNSSGNSNLMVWRLNSDGTRDTSFGVNSIVNFLFSSYGGNHYSLTEQQDGKILVTGLLDDSLYRRRAFLLRLKSDGTIDSSFATNGLYAFSDSSYFVKAIYLQDGKILFARQKYGGVPFLSHFNSNGTIDTSFLGYTQNLPTNFSIYSVSVQGNGNIICFGQISGMIYSFRMDSTGVLDNSYGLNGIDSVPQYPSANFIQHLVFPDESYLVAATYADGNQNVLRFFKILENGTIDSSWATNGVAQLDINPRLTDSPATVFLLLQPDQKILAGQTYLKYSTIGNADFSVARISSGLSLNVLENTAFSSKVNIYPNPITSNVLDFEFELDCDSKFSAGIIDLNGKVISLKKFPSQRKGICKQSMRLPENLASGTYFINIISGATQSTAKFELVK